MSKQIMNTTMHINTSQKTASKKAINYTFWILGVSWFLGFLFLNFIDFSNLILRTIFSLIYGFLPAIIAVIINKREGGNWRSLQFFKPSFKGIIISIIIPLLYVSIGTFLQIKLGYRLAPNWAVLGSSTEMFLVIVAGYFATTLLVMGEEIGWRGYLQNKMFNAYGKMKGAIILGLVWGLWHLPVALKGYNFPNHPYLEAFITYPLACVAFSLIIAYIGFNRYSIFTAALLHGANNHFNAIAISVTKLKNEFAFAMLSNVICINLILIFGYLYWRKIKRQQALEKNKAGK